jgi:hypothetical protein
MLYPILLQTSSSGLSSLGYDAQVLSSIAVMIGAIFVFFQLRQNNKIIRSSNVQAQAAVTQSKLTTEQMKQNNAISDMDLIMRLYEFANSAEVQSSWLTVLHSNFATGDEWSKFSEREQVAFYQIAALFESLGVLVQRGFVQVDVIDDMFQTELAWRKLEGFAKRVRELFGDEASYSSFESLYNKIKALSTS